MTSSSHTHSPSPAATPDLPDRWHGALLGTALGDAVGAPFEGAPHVDVAEVRRWLRSNRALRWTDDTAMALGLARSMVDRDGEVDLQHLGDTFAADHRREPWRGYGAGPPRVFAAATRGTPYLEAAASLFGGSGSFGNGAAMRVAPCAVAGGADLERVADLARRQSLVTHGHALAQDGAVVVAVAVASLAHTPADGDVGDAVAAVLPHLRTDRFRDGVRHAIERGPALDSLAIARELGRGVAAAESVPAAVAAFLGAPALPEEALLRAVGIGGDTDTIAAMAGAMVGARVGARALPDRLLDRLEARAELSRQALALAEVSGTG